METFQHSLYYDSKHILFISRFLAWQIESSRKWQQQTDNESDEKKSVFFFCKNKILNQY